MPTGSDFGNIEFLFNFSEICLVGIVMCCIHDLKRIPVSDIDYRLRNKSKVFHIIKIIICEPSLLERICKFRYI
jgi:hypothetical protein